MQGIKVISLNKYRVRLCNKDEEAMTLVSRDKKKYKFLASNYIFMLQYHSKQRPPGPPDKNGSSTDQQSDNNNTDNNTNAVQVLEPPPTTTNNRRSNQSSLSMSDNSTFEMKAPQHRYFVATATQEEGKQWMRSIINCQKKAKSGR